MNTPDTKKIIRSLIAVLGFAFSTVALSCPAGYSCVPYQYVGTYSYAGISSTTQPGLNAAALAAYSKIVLPNGNYYTAFAFGAAMNSTHWAYCAWTAQWFNGCGGTVTFTGTVCLYKYTDNGTECQIVADNTISLQNPLADVEPSGTTAVYANTSTTAYAQVVDSNNLPQPGVQVQFSVDVIANSGGHDGLHGVMRPKGKLLDCRDNTTEVESTTCMTQLDGKATVTFKAPIVSGTHTLSATCVSQACTGPASGNINVKVPGLEPMPYSTLYVFVGGEPGKAHTDNHYLTPDASRKLQQLAMLYHQLFPFSPVLRVNDASLVWGGVLDFNGTWTYPHIQHRRGIVIDVRANQLPDAIPNSNDITFQKMITKRLGGSYILHEEVPSNRHYHIHLLGIKG